MVLPLVHNEAMQQALEDLAQEIERFAARVDAGRVSPSLGVEEIRRNLEERNKYFSNVRTEQQDLITNTLAHFIFQAELSVEIEF